MDRIPIDYCRGCNLLEQCKVVYCATEPPCARKAEIAALVNEIHVAQTDGSDSNMVLYDVREKLRQLSAAPFTLRWQQKGKNGAGKRTRK